MAKKVKLTRVEWEIMESVWALGGAVSARQVHNHAFPSGEKAYTTVQTLLNKLNEKGWLEREKIGMVNFFTPAVSRDKMISRELQFYIAELFDGSVPALARFLIKTNDLSIKEIKTIKAYIEAREKEMESSRD